MGKLKDGAMTTRERLFCHEYGVDLNATQAAIRAGYSKASAASIGSELLKKPHIAAEIRQLQERRIKRIGITIDTITEQLKDDRRLAHQVAQPGAAVAASMGLAKLHGLIIDRKEMTGKDGAPLVPAGIEVTLVRPDHQSGDT